MTTAPVFMAVPEPLTERFRREFQCLVNEDLRDKYAAGHAYKFLSRRENLVLWLQTLTAIGESVCDQNAHDNGLIASHPDKPLGGGPTPQSYADAKREIQERKRKRGRTMQAVNERIAEVKRLIGVEPLLERAVGEVIEGLVTVRQCVMEGRDEDALAKIAGLMAALAGGPS